MLSYKLPGSKEVLPISSVKYRIKSLDEQKTKLDTAKNKLDADFTKDLFGKYWRECDIFKNEKSIIAKIGNTCNVSNAWLKCYEMLIYYDMIPKEPGDYLHFDNAAFPGSFIIAAHHLVKTQYPQLNYKWYASSLIAANESDADPLEDKYKL